MSSNEDKNQSADEDKSEENQKASADKSSDNNESEENKETSSDQNKSQGNEDEPADDESNEDKDPPAASAHVVTGPEKFVESGGSGGAAVQKVNGYEAMVHH
jgi:hypothetical protein